jgi:hypothetical protein
MRIKRMVLGVMAGIAAVGFSGVAPLTAHAANTPQDCTGTEVYGGPWIVNYTLYDGQGYPHAATVEEAYQAWTGSGGCYVESFTYVYVGTNIYSQNQPWNGIIKSREYRTDIGWQPQQGVVVNSCALNTWCYEAVNAWWVPNSVGFGYDSTNTGTQDAGGPAVYPAVASVW